MLILLNNFIRQLLKGEDIDCSIFDLVHKVLSFIIKSIIDDNSDKIKIKTLTDNKNLTITIESNSKTTNLDKICETLKKEHLDIISINEDKNIEDSDIELIYADKDTPVINYANNIIALLTNDEFKNII